MKKKSRGAKPKAKSSKGQNTIVFGQPVKVKVARLHFDPNNPRHAADALSPSGKDAEVIRQLIESSDIGELVQSIASNGYIDIEPMVVMPVANELIVLEGNRRLAAIKLLLDKNLQRECGFTCPELTKEVLDSLVSLTVYAVKKREDARDFIGFKHINGPHRWDALAKARFAADWFTKEKDSGVTLQDIAHRLGDRHDTVKRLVNGIFVLDQAKKKKIFDIADRSPGRAFAFSHLYTALTRTGFQDFLGLPSDWRREDPTPNPVPKDHLDNLRQVLVWLYGSKADSIAPVITSQNPHIKMLDEILQKPIARKTMLARNKLSEAYTLVNTPSVQFETALLNAYQNAEDALSKISGYTEDDPSLVQAADSLRKTSRIIFQTMSEIDSNES
jgi:hypothetical protein